MWRTDLSPSVAVELQNLPKSLADSPFAPERTALLLFLLVSYPFGHFQLIKPQIKTALQQQMPYFWWHSPSGKTTVLAFELAERKKRDRNGPSKGDTSSCFDLEFQQFFNNMHFSVCFLPLVNFQSHEKVFDYFVQFQTYFYRDDLQSLYAAKPENVQMNGLFINVCVCTYAPALTQPLHHRLGLQSEH